LAIIPGKAGFLVKKGLTILGAVLSTAKAPIISLFIEEEDEEVYLDCIDKLDL
jgi:hypothetical protein